MKDLLGNIPGRYRLTLFLYLIMTGTSFLTRIALVIQTLPSLDLTIWLGLKIFLVGLFFDTVTFTYTLIPFVLAIVIIPDKIHNWKFSRICTHIFFYLFIFAMLFNSVSEFIFFDEFSTRFNFIAVDYLIYTTEVVRNIRESYPVELIIPAIALIASIPYFLLRKLIDNTFPSALPLRRRFALSSSLLLLPLASLSLVDISQTEISPNNYANELSGNGLYGLVSAFKNNELDFNRFYAAKDDKVVMAHLRTLLQSRDSRGVTRHINNPAQRKKFNVILVCVESLSADYLGVFGNSYGWTPNLDRMAKESILFTHLFASGTRTVRGLEAINLSIPPLPGTAIVKRPGNENIFSLGYVMKKNGYDNHFIYGGRGYFDNMNYFFANNGYRDIDQTDMTKDEITFKNAWGVCDEDLYDKTIKQADISYRNNLPFYSFVMTTSNHRPYTFPAGKIDIPPGGRDGAVKYTDYAIGQLIEKSRKKPWFKDTVFVIVADHCSGSAGKTALPIKKYEIPLLIYAPEILKPQVVDRMMAQIDIAPTLLGLLGISYESSFFGRDMFAKISEPAERSFIGTFQKLGYIEGDRLLILTPRKKMEQFRFNRADGKTEPMPVDNDMLMNSLAHYQGSAYVYKNRLNRVH